MNQVSSKKQMVITVFNKKLMEFVKEVIDMYPTNKDFKSMRTQLRMIMNNAETLPLENFKKYVAVKYRTYINERNEQFFLQLDLSGTPFESFNYLKDMWRTTTPTTKNAMWKYIELLTKLSDKYE